MRTQARGYPDRVSSRLLCGIVFLIGVGVSWGGCALVATRPVQEMSYTTTALRAAKEVQADTLAPELFRQAYEWHFKAKQEYKLKNFKLAKEYADKARYLAEQAEFEAIRNGGNRGDSGAAPEDTAAQSKEGYSYPQPTGTPADSYEQRKAEEQRGKTGGGSTPSNGLPGGK